MPNILAVVDDPLFDQHRASSEHPERPERLGAARSALGTSGLQLLQDRLSPRDASDEELLRVHDGSYVELLGQTAGESGYHDPDTYFAPASSAAARRAAGGAVGMTETLLSGEADYGLALLRPPGHHARPKTAMGFCLLNNVAVAAAHARAGGADRVLVLDWDVHHGNGTQEMFYADPAVLYVSLHQWPFYPGSGAASEVGTGDGRGFTVNVPLSPGATDDVYVAAFERLLSPVTRQFDPDLVLVSAGFDAHERDPLASMSLSDAGYARMLEKLVEAIPRGAAGRLGLVLEGGYDLVGLQGSLGATLVALGSDPAPTSGSPAALGRHEADLVRAVEAQRPYWELE